MDHKEFIDAVLCDDSVDGIAEKECVFIPEKALRDLAIIIHAATCRHNHADGCGWYYEEWTKPDKQRQKPEYLDRAKKVQDVMSQHVSGKDEINAAVLEIFKAIHNTYFVAAQENDIKEADAEILKYLQDNNISVEGRRELLY